MKSDIVPTREETVLTSKRTNTPAKKAVPGLRAAKTAAILIKSQQTHFDYGALLRKARGNINITDTGIDVSRIHPSYTGGVLIEIPEVDGATKADKLVSKLRQTLDGEDVIISRPVKRGKIIIKGFDTSINATDVAAVVATKGGSDVNDIQMGAIKLMLSGMHMVWIRLPLLAANHLAALQKIKMGWTIATIDMLRARSLQCYRCLKFGYVASKAGILSIDEGTASVAEVQGMRLGRVRYRSVALCVRLLGILIRCFR